MPGSSEPLARIGYEANLVDPDAAWLRLIYTGAVILSTGDHAADLWRSPLVVSMPAWRARMADRLGARRSSSFPGGRHFASREAYGLTYRSCRERGKLNGLFRRLATGNGRAVHSAPTAPANLLLCSGEMSSSFASPNLAG